LEWEIDQQVYALYGLTPEEINRRSTRMDAGFFHRGGAETPRER
jgi:hypothetical protein